MELFDRINYVLHKIPRALFLEITKSCLLQFIIVDKYYDQTNLVWKFQVIQIQKKKMFNLL